MKKIIFISLFLVIIVGICVCYSDITNPYSSITIVKPFFTTTVAKNGEIGLHEISPIYFVKNPIIDLLTYPQRAVRIVENRIFPEKPFLGNEKQIIQQLHAKRFDVNKPYVVSGANFPELYVRNFGIFYAAMLDPRIALSKNDWEDRQRVTLQTVATHLALLQKSGKEYTTFIPIWSNTFTAVNWNAEPSDSLYALYYSLEGLTNDRFISSNFPSVQQPLYPLQTKQAGNMLLQQYRSVLSNATNTYLQNIIDPSTGIIKKNITLSSARDGIRRQSSFYDNVIAWDTAKLATDLGVAIQCPEKYTDQTVCNFSSWKQHIIATFWDNKTGIFLDDLSSNSVQHHIYSGDAFVVLQTKFLDVTNKEDKEKLEREIAYVQNNHLDIPIPLQYAIHDQPNNMYLFVRYFAPSYMGQSMWSHWGMEYIKSLILLSQDNPAYASTAQKDLQIYKTKIETYGGYPELYDKNGTIFETGFYKSLLLTGWVINYEQTKMMLSKLKTKSL